MDMWLVLSIGAGAVVLLLMVRRVAAGTERGRAVLPSSLGQEIKIRDLKSRYDEFKVFFSGSQAHPGALAFIPKQARVTWELKQGMNGWKPVEEERQLDELVSRMNRNLEVGAQQPRVRVLELPSSLKAMDTNRAYLYSDQVTTPRKVSGPNPAVSFRAVRPRRRPGFER